MEYNLKYLFFFKIFKNHLSIFEKKNNNMTLDNNLLKKINDFKSYIIAFVYRQLESKADINHNHSYDELQDKPTIPTAYVHPEQKQCNYSVDISGKANVTDFNTVTATITYIDDSTEDVDFYIVPNQQN